MSENWSDLRISNDFLFGKVMRNQTVCKKLIELILDIQIDHIEYPENQKVIDLTADARSIRLDVYVKDGQNTVYDIEMQATDTKELPKRSRYYQDLIDLQLIEKGETYNKLNKSYVIFICLFDLFHLGRHKYSFTYQCLEHAGLELGDETTKIFLNASGTMDDVGPELRAFLDYVAGKEISETTAFVCDLERLVASAKNNDDWRLEYLTIEMRDQLNYERGIEQNRRSVILKAYQKGYPIEEIADLAGCDETTVISVINATSNNE